MFLHTHLFFCLSKLYRMHFNMNVGIKYLLNIAPDLTLTLVDCHFCFSGVCIHTSSIGSECVSSGHSLCRVASSLVVVKVLLKRYFYTIFGNCLHKSAVYVQCYLEVLSNFWTLSTAQHTLFYGIVILYLHALKAHSCSAIWKTYWVQEMS